MRKVLLDGKLLVNESDVKYEGKAAVYHCVR